MTPYRRLKNIHRNIATTIAPYLASLYEGGGKNRLFATDFWRRECAS